MLLALLLLLFLVLFLVLFLGLFLVPVHGLLLWRKCTARGAGRV